MLHPWTGMAPGTKKTLLSLGRGGRFSRFHLHAWILFLRDLVYWSEERWQLTDVGVTAHGLLATDELAARVRADPHCPECKMRSILEGCEKRHRRLLEWLPPK